jgi:TolB-like protein
MGPGLEQDVCVLEIERQMNKMDTEPVLVGNRAGGFFLPECDPASLSVRSSLPTAQPAAELRLHLERVVSSATFRSSPRLVQLLRYLFEQTLAGCGGGLSQYSIAYDGLRLGDDFDTGKSSLIRSHVHRLRRALDAYYAASRDGDKLRIALPTSGYGLVFETVAPLGPRVPLAKPPVLALVEFKGIGLEGPWLHLPQLLAEELSGMIAGAGVLRLMGPFSRSRLQSDKLDVLELATRHPLDFVLDGSVQRVGEQLVLRSRLLDAKTGLLVWSGKEKLLFAALDLADFEVQLMRQLAAEISGEMGRIHIQLTAVARVKPQNALTVYEAVLLGRMYLADFHHESLPRAVATLRQAVCDFPAEATLHSTLAVLLSSLGAEPTWLADPPADEIRALAARAVMLAPTDPWSILAQAFSAAIHHDRAQLGRIGASVQANERAGPMLQASLGALLCFQKVTIETGLLLIARACESGPHYPRAVHLARCLVLLDSGQRNAALHELDSYQVCWGWADPLIRGTIAWTQGDAQTASDEWQRVKNAFPSFATDGPRSLGFLWHEDYVTLHCGAMREAGSQNI